MGSGKNPLIFRGQSIIGIGKLGEEKGFLADLNLHRLVNHRIDSLVMSCVPGLVASLLLCFSSLVAFTVSVKEIQQLRSDLCTTANSASWNNRDGSAGFSAEIPAGNNWTYGTLSQALGNIQRSDSAEQ